MPAGEIDIAFAFDVPKLGVVRLRSKVPVAELTPRGTAACRRAESS